MNIEYGIDFPQKGFKQIAAFNSYALRKVGSIFLIGFAIRDEYGTILSSVSFSIMEPELMKMKNNWANYISNASDIKPVAGKYSLNTFDFKSPTDINVIRCIRNGDAQAEMAVGTHSHWELNDMIKTKTPQKGSQVVNLGNITVAPIALLHSETEVQFSFIFDVLNLLGSDSAKGEKK